ncbi:DUF1294 domain-containing protein [Mariniblastus fucicola]|uniref:DUF1294 domain-containing protein n=1 Tax=Mariniblastus fucicola TaxID=980251 RepID=A0A5B9PNM2_9BACT|nr:DUF1294 domain-containing protein [Mariniblastus fucicola]QEG24141.1 hypothetical protein MFFC18_40570 [Mariniblastus fucicola]
MQVLYYLIAMLVLSAASFVLYGWDKRQAKNDGWRVPERNLHVLSLLGGWPGALMGQKYFRHKTQKQSFQITYWFTVVANLGMVIVAWFQLL